MSDMESTEYTPTTNLVRAAYTRAVPESLVASQAEMMAEFDRWLAGVLADAKAEQREIDAQIARRVGQFENEYGIAAAIRAALHPVAETTNHQNRSTT